MLKIKHYILACACLAIGGMATTANAASTPASAIAAEAPDSISAAIAAEVPDSIPVSPEEFYDDEPQEVTISEFDTDDGHISIMGTDSIPVIAPFDKFAGYNEWEEREVEYNPNANRAVWMSALCPGLGQVYNRRYWKLPIIVGGYLGLAYATSWNNSMLKDYTRAYRDLLDNDPSSKSYMDFFPSTVKEENLDKTWLTNILKTRRDYFRRNRDLCIICMVGVYFLAMVDAYVDASLAHFDITPQLSMNVTPALMQDGRNVKPSVGMLWTFNF